MWRSSLISSALWVLLPCCSGESPGPPADNIKPPPAAVAPPAPKPAREPIVVSGAGLLQPDSVVHDAEADVYLVSNIAGKPLAKDGNGFISRIGPDGQVLALRWIAGSKGGLELHAPKGMAISGPLLYVADIDTVRVFELASGRLKRTQRVKGASFLNDVTAHPSGVFVSDSGLDQWGPYVEANGKDAIFRLQGPKVVPLLADKALGHPNGLWADAKGVLVVNKAGVLMRVGLDGTRSELATLAKGTLDGLVVLPDGTLYISSWDLKGLFRGPVQGPFEKAFDRLASPADLGYDAKRKRLLIPQLSENTLRIQPLAVPD